MIISSVRTSQVQTSAHDTAIVAVAQLMSREITVTWVSLMNADAT